LVAAYKASGERFLSAIATSHAVLFDLHRLSTNPLSWRQFGGLSLSDIANDPLPLMPAVPARTLDYPTLS
jgi:hypothetical protein